MGLCQVFYISNTRPRNSYKFAINSVVVDCWLKHRTLKFAKDNIVAAVLPKHSTAWVVQFLNPSSTVGGMETRGNSASRLNLVWRNGLVDKLEKRSKEEKFSPPTEKMNDWKKPKQILWKNFFSFFLTILFYENVLNVQVSGSGAGSSGWVFSKGPNKPEFLSIRESRVF